METSKQRSFRVDHRGCGLLFIHAGVTGGEVRCLATTCSGAGDFDLHRGQTNLVSNPTHALHLGHRFAVACSGVYSRCEHIWLRYLSLQKREKRCLTPRRGRKRRIQENVMRVVGGQVLWLAPARALASLIMLAFSLSTCSRQIKPPGANTFFCTYNWEAEATVPSGRAVEQAVGTTEVPSYRILSYIESQAANHLTDTANDSWIRCAGI